MNLLKYKNSYIAILLIPLLFACGPSPEEIAEQERLAEAERLAELKRRNDLATVTCNFMAESRNMDAALRIKEINSARERLGEELYLGTDSGIVESFKYGLCNELVLNDPDYNSKLLANMELVAEQERIAEERRIEADKAAAERRKIEAEERRIAAEKRAEKAAEEARLKAIEDKKNIEAWSKVVASVISEYPIETTLRSIKFGLDYADNETIDFGLSSCKNLKGLLHKIVFKFKNDAGELVFDSGSIGNCSGYSQSLTNDGYSWSPKFTDEIVDLFYKEKPASKEDLESVHIELTGSLYWSYYKEHFADARIRREIEKKIDPKTYGAPFNSSFDQTIVKSKYQIYP